MPSIGSWRAGERQPLRREGEEANRSWHLKVADHFEKREGPLSDFGIAARHRDAAGDRAGALGLYERWALSLRGRHAYAACIQVAQEGLKLFPPDEAEDSRIQAAELWLRISDGLEPLGRISERAMALSSALSSLGSGQSPEARFTRASIYLRQGRDQVQRGEVLQAEQTFQKGSRMTLRREGLNSMGQ